MTPLAERAKRFHDEHGSLAPIMDTLPEVDLPLFAHVAPRHEAEFHPSIGMMGVEMEKPAEKFAAERPAKQLPAAFRKFAMARAEQRPKPTSVFGAVSRLFSPKPPAEGPTHFTHEKKRPP
jgi:hypothetical protein